MLWYIYTVEYYITVKERILAFCDSMDGTGDYYAKLNKPVNKRQTPFDLTYKWNPVKQINYQPT